MKRVQARADRIVLLVLAVLVLVGILLVGIAPAFRAGSIDVTGTRVLDPASLVQSSGLHKGQSFLSGIGGSLPTLLGLRYGTAEGTLLKENPYLKSVIVRFHFPGRISIEAVERVEVAYLEVHDSIAVIDSERVAVALLQTGPPAGIPVIEGIDVQSVRLGAPIVVDRPQSLVDALLLLSAVLDADTDTRGELKLLSTVRSVRPAADDLIYMTIVLPATQEELIVREDDPGNASADMRWLRYAILQGDMNGLGSGILDLSGTQPRFIPDGK